MRSMGNIGTLPMATNASRIIANSVRHVKGRLGIGFFSPWFGENSHLSRSFWAFFVFRFFCTCKNSCYYLYLISLELVTTESYYYFCVCSKNNKSYMFYGYDFKNQKTDETFGPIVRKQDANQSAVHFLSMVETSPETTQTNSVSNKWNRITSKAQGFWIHASRQRSRRTLRRERTGCAIRASERKAKFTWFWVDKPVNQWSFLDPLIGGR